LGAANRMMSGFSSMLIGPTSRPKENPATPGRTTRATSSHLTSVSIGIATARADEHTVVHVPKIGKSELPVVSVVGFTVHEKARAGVGNGATGVAQLRLAVSPVGLMRSLGPLLMVILSAPAAMCAGRLDCVVLTCTAHDQMPTLTT